MIFLEAFQNFLNNDYIFKPEDIKTVLKNHVRHYFRFCAYRKIKYFNVPASFDIETTSFYANGEKTAIMYEWTFGIFGAVIIGRTWDEFITMINTLVSELKLNDEKRLIIYVHNLGYEFQFMRKHFNWMKIFAIDTRKPIYAITDQGIEFRCSYLLSGYSLEKLAEHVQCVKIEKMVGDLDYSLMRHSRTPLTLKEIGYCINDVKIVMAYIMDEIIKNGNIIKIPLTKTGYVRNYCRETCFYDPDEPHKGSYKRFKYKTFLNNLTLDVSEYRQLKRAFQGGFTHANIFCVGKVIEDVTSFDFTSSYPAVMINEMFPMSKSELIEIKGKEDFEENLKYYCCLFDVEFINLESKLYFENFISSYRCTVLEKPIINNGRIVSASRLVTTITEQDFIIIKTFYSWEKMRVMNFRRYRKGYLPTDFVKAVLKLYQDKTQLKGIEGKEVEYLQSKEMLNSTYGMAVTDIIRELYTYIDDEWGIETPDYDNAIKKYNKNPNRFLFYPWGVWVTAYARRNLFTGIKEFEKDYLYSDTDSIKVINVENHKAYIEKYNKWVQDKTEKALKWHKIPIEAACPETIKGVKKPIGIWDYDGHYDKFKTMGAKRYMTEEKGKLNITVAGLNKGVCVPYLIKKYGSKVFEAFNNELFIPAEYTGQNTHTYIDEPRQGILKDYTGVNCEYKELSGVHLEAAEYSMGLSQGFINYIFSVKEVQQ